MNLLRRRDLLGYASCLVCPNAFAESFDGDDAEQTALDRDRALLLAARMSGWFGGDYSNDANGPSAHPEVSFDYFSSAFAPRVLQLSELQSIGVGAPLPALPISSDASHCSGNDLGQFSLNFAPDSTPLHNVSRSIEPQFVDSGAANVLQYQTSAMTSIARECQSTTEVQYSHLANSIGTFNIFAAGTEYGPTLGHVGTNLSFYEPGFWGNQYVATVSTNSIAHWLGITATVLSVGLDVEAYASGQMNLPKLSDHLVAAAVSLTSVWGAFAAALYYLGDTVDSNYRGGLGAFANDLIRAYSEHNEPGPKW